MISDIQPLVTIVTPSFNQGRYLEQTILSVLQQDYPNIEYIIIDGASTDDSLNIIKKYENRLAWWISETDQGQSDALIKGFNKAKGKYLAWLCGDDILEPSMIRVSVTFLERYPNAVLSYGNRTRIDAKGNIIGFNKSYINNFLFRFGLGLPQETVVFRKDIYDQVGGINLNLQMVMDYDLWCKFYKIGTFLYIPAFLGRFRSHCQNKSTIFSSEIKEIGLKGKFTSEFKQVFKEHFNGLFSMKIRRIAIFINSVTRIFLMRTKKYKMLKNQILTLQNT